MAKLQTISELFKANVISGAEVTAAVEAYIANPKATTFGFAGGYSINFISAVRAQPSAKKLINEPEASEALRRAVVRKAILLVQPATRPS